MSLPLEILREIQIADSSHCISEEIRIKMVKSLDSFILDSINKFVKGQLEHGGDIRDRYLDKEIRMEMIDSFWYQQAKLWKK